MADTQESIDLETLRREFVARFNRQKLASLTLEEYALNSQDSSVSKDSFCYWLERKTGSLGSIIGSSSIKFGVYYGKQGKDTAFKWRWTSWTNENFDTIKKELLDLYDAGEQKDIGTIKSNHLSPMVKGKFLSLYFPDRYLNIFSEPLLHHFLNKLSIPYDPKADPVDLREKLISYKQSDAKFAQMTAIDFGHALYGMFGGLAPKEEPQNEAGEKLYEDNQNEKINGSSLKKAPVIPDRPEPLPEQIVTSFGQVYKIDPANSRRAIIDSGYSCEVDVKHKSFTRKDGVHTYTEAHHLIPRSCQGEFEYSLDVPANIVSLCSNCHNWLHYGIGFDDILKKLYDERAERLKAVGLDITFKQLKGYYA